MNKPIIAFLYDFDKTLCTRDMQEYSFIPSVGMEPDEFWEATGRLAKSEKMDSILTYMYCMISCSEAAGNPLNRDQLVACGKHIEYHPGVLDWFERINEYGREAGLEVEHYILSSGLKEIIEGTEIAKYFKKIYASEFMYKNDRAIWAKMAVNYTNKTQFVYRINKGVFDIYNDADLNNSRPDNERRVLFANMVYIGDGLTDVPCMKLVKSSGGHSIALYKQGESEKVMPLLQHERVDWIFEADYREGKPLDKAVHSLLQKLAYDNELFQMTASQKKNVD